MICNPMNQMQVGKFSKIKILQKSFGYLLKQRVPDIGELLLLMILCLGKNPTNFEKKLACGVKNHG